MQIQIGSDQGTVIQTVHVDGTVDTLEIPPNAVITVQLARGWGGAIQVDSSVPMATAQADAATALQAAGAK